MSTKAQKQQSPMKMPSHALYSNDGLSPKKTALIIVTVIGCIAILWPKVFHPMMFGQPPQKAAFKDHRGPSSCCDVVLDRENFMNVSTREYGPQLFRKAPYLYTGDIYVRQERPAHLHPESIYQAMKERGRAIPSTQTVPIVERKPSPSNPPPRIVDGRPGPIPGMRPPMGAGALHQPQQKGNSMGFIMPLYTIGIIVFFGYTIMKLVFKKPLPNAPYGAAPQDPNFRNEVFGKINGRHVEEINGSKLVVTAIQGLIDAADEELNIRENSATSETTKKKSETSNASNLDNVDQTTQCENEENEQITKLEETSENSIVSKNEDNVNGIEEQMQNQNIKREKNLDRSVTVVGMEITASCEGGMKWTGRPPTPIIISQNEHSKNLDVFPEPQSIYLEGSLPHESKILVSDSEIKKEEVYDKELNGSPDEPAVILSSKMTLSLINLDTPNESTKSDLESPLADDIEIITPDEQ